MGVTVMIKNDFTQENYLEQEVQLRDECETFYDRKGRMLVRTNFSFPYILDGEEKHGNFSVFVIEEYDGTNNYYTRDEFKNLKEEFVWNTEKQYKFNRLRRTIDSIKEEFGVELVSEGLKKNLGSIMIEKANYYSMTTSYYKIDLSELKDIYNNYMKGLGKLETIKEDK